MNQHQGPGQLRAAHAAVAAPATTGSGIIPDGRPRMVRRRSGRVIAGVAGGVADHLGIPVLWVRAVLTVLAGLGGAGVLAYGLLWVFVAQAGPEAERVEVTPRERQQAIGLVAVGIGLAVAAGASSGTAWGAWITGPLGVALVGAAVVWREADQPQRRRALGGRLGLVRALAGVLLVAAGLAVFLLASIDIGPVQFGLLAVVATLVGVALITVPWWLRLVRDLGEERRARIRTQEREDIAAHLHDSVLQTLALIQKQAGAPREVRRLARGQERELRNWLYGPQGYGRATGPAGRDGGVGDTAGSGGPQTLVAALASVAAEVEDTYAVSVQSVVVGDCPLDGHLAALVQAAREAMVNAAKHAGVGEVSLYVEVEPEVVNVFVRDRGAGFAPESVPADRHGLARSIRGRMERNGGAVRLRTSPGEGTEVQLSMPGSPATREARTP